MVIYFLPYMSTKIFCCSPDYFNEVVSNIVLHLVAESSVHSTSAVSCRFLVTIKNGTGRSMACGNRERSDVRWCAWSRLHNF